MLALQPAELAFTDDGTPYSAAFDDIYHSQAGGFAQSREVFLAGNGLPGRWQGRRQFAICETGFGMGLNFLATWHAWRHDPHRAERLHFISCELHPFTQSDLGRLYQQFLATTPELAALGEQLLSQWPALVPGLHRIELEAGQLVLTLLLGDALSLLTRLSARIDAFFLDGFSPRKNPELWQIPLYKQFTRLANEGATLATYTAVGEVRRGLESAGFTVARKAGFGYKRHMLAGSFRGKRADLAPAQERHAIVIGAGLAGSAICERLAQRGWRISLLEQGAASAQGASGNLAGAYRPVVSLDDNLQARIARAGFLYGQRWLDKLPAPSLHRVGALQLARTPAEDARFQQIALQQGWPPDYLAYVDQTQASELAGQPVAGAGLWFPSAGWIRPRDLVNKLLQKAGKAITASFGTEIARLEWRHDRWLALDQQGSVLAEAPTVILANAADADRFVPDLILGRDQRLVSHLPPLAAPQIKTVVCRGGYLTPGSDEAACLGSSPSPDGESSSQAQAANLQLLSQMLPGHESRFDAEQLAGRRCSRPGTPDRLPIVGPIADAEAFLSKHAGSLHLAPRRQGLYALTGFGARGLVWSGLMAELLACQIEGEPLPLERDLVLALDPARFLARRAC
ncbi:bifunctional tRNA (5-methylaminomethyl-2-thiouridine)(34)-methyltransferase MnmD/FAD-dependent 5-carboxymethylaminomethyl-2-thiouridine(34) oxidoreductase MnmC [Chitinimonas naiadis]